MSTTKNNGGQDKLVVGLASWVALRDVPSKVRDTKERNLMMNPIYVC
jgi:hypothetical protein